MNKIMGGIISLIIWYLPAVFVQIISGLITVNSMNPWYIGLEKGCWTPPSWVFGPTWAVLYIMMSISVWMVYLAKATRLQYRSAYLLFFTQLLANGLWSLLFFGLHMPGWALVDLFILIILVFITAVYFFSIRQLAGLFLLPYLLWIIYAFYLNAAIWWLN